MLNYDVMGVLLEDSEWEVLKRKLIVLRKNGFRAITTPIWWGIVETLEGNYNWNYYREYAQIVRAAGLKWIPIFATHKCGSSVGDDVYIPLPEWLFKKAPFEEMLFKDENGYFCDEVLSLWWSETSIFYHHYGVGST